MIIFLDQNRVTVWKIPLAIPFQRGISAHEVTYIVETVFDRFFLKNEKLHACNNKKIQVKPAVRVWNLFEILLILILGLTCLKK